MPKHKSEHRPQPIKQKTLILWQILWVRCRMGAFHHKHSPVIPVLQIALKPLVPLNRRTSSVHPNRSYSIPFSSSLSSQMSASGTVVPSVSCRIPDCRSIRSSRPAAVIYQSVNQRKEYCCVFKQLCSYGEGFTIVLDCLLS